MKKKTYQLGVRMDEDLLARLRRFEEQTGISSSALARATLESALDYFESEKEIVFPLCCVPRKSIIPPPPFQNKFSSRVTHRGIFLHREFSASEKRGVRFSQRKLRTVSAMPSRTETGRRSTPSARLSFALETT